MQHGVKAVELLRDLKRSDVLQLYDEDGIKQITDETNALYREVVNVLSTYDQEERDTPYIGANIVVHHTSMKKNKRCLLAYIMNRLHRIKELRWDLHTAVLPDDVKENMSANEAAFFESYHKLLSEYMNDVGLDLTVDLKTPPKDLFIEVRVKQQTEAAGAGAGGAVVTDRGNTVVLDPNTTHFLRRSDVEALIRQGVLEHV